MQFEQKKASFSLLSFMMSYTYPKINYLNTEHFINTAMQNLGNFFLLLSFITVRKTVPWISLQSMSVPYEDYAACQKVRKSLCD